MKRPAIAHPVRTTARCLLGLALAWGAATPSWAMLAGDALQQAIDTAQPKIVKLYGAGGFRGLEAYQTGMLISPEGHILTVFSYVLDTDEIGVTLSDGRRFTAELLGADPQLEIALLKIDAENLPHFDLAEAAEVEAGARILALSNLFGVATGNEPASVQHGVVSVKTDLEARRGVFETPYRGPVYVLDAITNNPGAAGGALVTTDGRLVGMLGKELRNAQNNTWLNYAIPIDALRPTVQAIREGRFVAGDNPEPEEPRPAESARLTELGIVLVPNVLERTPPYVDYVRAGSPADKAGLKPDDLIVLVDDRLVPSCAALRAEVEAVEPAAEFTLTVLRDQQTLQFTLPASP